MDITGMVVFIFSAMEVPLRAVWGYPVLSYQSVRPGVTTSGQLTEILAHRKKIQGTVVGAGHARDLLFNNLQKIAGMARSYENS